MNFYKHHIGDYDADTAHLSWLEDAAYRRLISLYYRREAPLPLDDKEVCRLVRASSKQERAAVASVLSEFFERGEDGWHSKRCDEELSAASEATPKRKAKLDNDLERKARSRERRKKIFEELRKHGIGAVYNAPTAELLALLSQVVEPTHPLLVTPPVTRDRWRDKSRDGPPVTRDTPQPVTRAGTANQTPDSITPDPRDRSVDNFARPPWLGSRKGVEGRAAELGMPPWDEAASQLGQAEPWPTYRAEVMRRSGLAPEPGPQAIVQVLRGVP